MQDERLLRWLPALCAVVMLAGSSAAAMPPGRATLCSGGSVPVPGQQPDDCDKACHAGCGRRKGRP